MSSCAPTDRLLQTLKVHVPGVTDELLRLELFNTADEFFRRTSAWNYINDIELVEEQNEYVFATPVNTSVVRLMGVTHQGLPVPSATGTGVVQASVGVIDSSELFPDGDVAVDPVESDLSGGIFSYAIYRPNYITITAVPDAEGRKYPLKAILALSLSRSCLECDCGDWSVDEWQWDMYFQDWLDGTLSRLYAMPSKPWTNKELMVYHGKRFRNHMAFRKQEAPRGFAWNQQPWRFPRGW